MEPINVIEALAKSGYFDATLGLDMNDTHGSFDNIKSFCFVHGDQGSTDSNQGCHKLVIFWRLFQQQWPSHDVCADIQAKVVDPAFLIPCYIHGDGGRGYKKSEIMCLQWQPILGKGTRKTFKGPEEFPLNFLGRSFATRFIFAVMPRGCYKHTSAPLNRLFRAFGPSA